MPGYTNIPFYPHVQIHTFPHPSPSSLHMTTICLAFWNYFYILNVIPLLRSIGSLFQEAGCLAVGGVSARHFTLSSISKLIMNQLILEKLFWSLKFTHLTKEVATNICLKKPLRKRRNKNTTAIQLLLTWIFRQNHHIQLHVANFRIKQFLCTTSGVHKFLLTIW